MNEKTTKNYFWYNFQENIRFFFPNYNQKHLKRLFIIDNNKYQTSNLYKDTCTKMHIFSSANQVW